MHRFYICLIYFAESDVEGLSKNCPHTSITMQMHNCSGRGKKISLLFNHHNFFLEHDSKHNFPLHIYLEFGVLLGLGGTAGSRAEREREESSSSTATPDRLCFVWRAVSCIHRKRSYWKQIFSDSWFEPKPDWNHSQLLWPVRRKKEEGIEGGGKLWNTSLSSSRVWGISFIICSVLQPHIFSLFFLSVSSPNCCPFLLVQGSCFTAECCLVFQMSTHRSLPGRRSYPSLGGTVRVHTEPWSDGTARAQT